jgi:CHAT domain-containing protein/tetratricopeptide (TPR) repeat protein
MAKRITINKSNGIISGPSFFLIILLSASLTATPQSLQLTQEEFSKKLGNAYLQKNSSLVDSLIRNHRLYVKPFVNNLIEETLISELNGNLTESGQTRKTVEKSAADFEKIFGERSLATGVKYLTSWTKEQKFKKLTADSLYSEGTSIRGNIKDREKAVSLYKQAFDLYKEIGDERGEGEILGGLGLIFFNSEDFEKSLSYYRYALKVRVKIDDKQLIGNSLNSIGGIYLNYLPDYEEALHFLDSAEILRAETGDFVNLGRTIHAKASAYDKLNLSDQALLYFKKSIEINQKAGDQQRVAEAFLHLGDILTGTGYYFEALEDLEKALSIYTDLKEESKICEVLTHTGFVYSNMGEYTTALGKLSEALQISKEAADNNGVAGAYNNLGIVFKSAGRLDKAIEYFNNSLKIYEESGDQLNVISSLSNLGTVYFALNDFSKAADYHNRGLELSRKIRDKDNETHCRLNLANDLLRLGKLEESMSNYEVGLKIARSLNSPELTWKITAGMAEINKLRGEYEKAVELNDTALKFLSNIRITLKDDKLKTSFMAAERYAFEDIINMLTDLHLKYPGKGYDIRSFRYAEESKARAFLDLLSGSEKNSDHDSNCGFSRVNYPKLLTLEKAHSLCPDKNTVILEYSVGDSSTSLWVITRSAHKLFKLPGIKALEEQIEPFRFALLNPDRSNNEFLTKGGYSLYRLLLEPAEPFLSRKSKLIIIPDGILNYIPFEILLTDNKGISTGNLYSNLPFLIKKYPVSYAQSASVINNLLTKVNGAGKPDPDLKKLIAFGDPVYENPTDTSNSSVSGYKRLKYSGEEVENIASFFKKGNAEVHLRNEATEDNVKREGALKNFNYVHFATHGFIDERKPDLSSLVLTKKISSQEDGMLQATEIYGLKLNADLVVLSACQSGLGKLVRGEGIVGLTRAFMYAGTPAVLVSLWSVSDVSTSVLMRDFYKNLTEKKLSKTDALRNAQLTMLGNEKFAHPFYWAPFVIIGDWR